MVKLYTKNHCPQCRQAKRVFDAMKIEYMELNIEENAIYKQEAKEIARTVPIIKYNEKIILGFNIDEIRLLKKEIV